MPDDPLRKNHGSNACRVLRMVAIHFKEVASCGNLFRQRLQCGYSLRQLGEHDDSRIGLRIFGVDPGFMKSRESVRVFTGRVAVNFADMATKLELARNIIWKAAWSLDNADDSDRQSIGAWALMARSYTAEVVHDVSLLSAECFGAMGVMRDMPLQKYVHDATVFLHSDTNDSASRLRIAEAVIGYNRSRNS